MKNHFIIPFLFLATITSLCSYYFISASPVPDFQSYEGFLFYDLEEEAFFLEDIESGTDILLRFKYDVASELDFDGLQHAEVHGLYNRVDNSLRVMALHETTDILAINP